MGVIINLRRGFVLIVLICLFMGRASSQELVLPTGYPHYETIYTEDVSPGYAFLTLETTLAMESWLAIIDKYGTPVYYRYFPSVNTFLQLQPSGFLNFSMKTETASTTAIMDSNFTIIDQVPIKNGYMNDRHDFFHSSNGEFILIAKNPVVMDLSGVVEGGFADAVVQGGVIQIQSPQKEVLFDWNGMDHYNVTDTYSDLTLAEIDNVHPNSIELDLDGNLLLISRAMNEVTKIDRSTGDIMWRLGGKNNQFHFPDTADAFSRPHNLRVLENGNYTLFDNGNERVPQFSRAIEYQLNTNNMTATKVWDYSGDNTYFTRIKGSAQRLENGNTIIGYGVRYNPAVLEVTPEGNVAWRLNFEADGSSSMVNKHPWHTTLFTPNTDSINFGQWDGNTQSVYALQIRNNSDKDLELSNYHVHTSAFSFASGLFPMSLSPGEERSMDLIYFPDEIDSTVVNDVLTINSDINSDTLVQRVAVQVHLTGTKVLTSITDNHENFVRLHPNPAEDYVTIEWIENVRGSVCIYAMNGSLVFKTHILGNNAKIDLKKLENGMYIIEVLDEVSNARYRKKFVKQ